MARALRIQYPGAHYHVTCRGNEQKRIFLDGQDEEVFLERLSVSAGIYNVSVLAYVCMNNHFHLLLTTPDGNLSEFMRHFNICYTSAFNRRHRRVGHLYQGRYKALLIDADNYLLEVSRYIHLNPIRVRAFSRMSPAERWDVLLDYKPSSLPGYLLVRHRRDFLNYERMLEYRGGDNRKGRQAYRQFIKQGLGGALENPLNLGKGRGIVGDADFVAWIKEKFLDKGTSQREQPALRSLTRRFDPEELIDQFVHLVGRPKEYICRRGRHTIERTILMELLYRFCRIPQPEIGRLVGGIDYSGVSQARRRLQIRLEKEPELKKKFDDLDAQLVKLSRVKI